MDDESFRQLYLKIINSYELTPDEAKAILQNILDRLANEKVIQETAVLELLALEASQREDSEQSRQV